MRFTRLLAVGAAVGLTAAWTAQPAAAIEIYAFKGTVSDALGRALASATVKDGAGLETTTAADGTYRIGESNTGRYTLTANRSDTSTASQTVTVQLPVDQTVNFTLLYKISGLASPASVSAAAGSATTTLTVTSHAPQPGADGDAGGKSCVRVTDGRTGVKSPATLISTSGATSTWRSTISVPQGTTQGSYPVTFAAEDCAGTTVLSQTGTTSYVVDNTPPVIRRLTPFDNGNTVFTVQRLLASIRDTGGSGLNPSSVSFTLTEEGGTTTTLPGSYSSATGWAKTVSQSLLSGRVYRVSVTARDFAGNVVTVTQRPIAHGGGFLVTSVLPQSTLADIPSTPCRIEDRGPLGYKTAVCDNVPLHYASSSATVDGTRHGPDGGFIDHTAALETAVLRTTIAGQQLSMGAYQATDARWAPKTGALRFDGPTAGVGAQSVAVLERQVNIGTLEVPVPATWAGEVTVEMAPTATTAAVSACADPSSSGATVTCTPDPMANRVLVSLNVPADQVASVAASQAAAAGGQVLHLYSGGYQAVLPTAAAAALVSDSRVRGVARMLMRTGAVPAQLAESVVDRMLQGQLPEGFDDLKLATSATPRAAESVPGGDASYQVDLASGGETIGYAITSKVFEGTPVLRLTHGDLVEVAEARRPAVEAASGRTVASYSFVHLDAFTEAARFVLSDGSSVDVSLNTGDPVHEGRLNVFSSSASRPARSADDALANEVAWNNAGGDSSLTPETWPADGSYGVTSVSAPSIKLVSGGGPTFPNYSWYRGCTPTAAGMVEAYWSQRGFPSIMSATDYARAAADAEDGFSDGDSPQSRVLLDAIGDKMGTATDGSGGTYMHNIGPGIRNFELSKGVNRPVVTVANPSRNRLVSQFESEQVPTTASFISWLMLPVTPAPGYGQFYPDRIHHSVALMGYAVLDGTTYMVMHDDFRYDGETIVAWNGDWDISQFDYPK